jgi:signal transduction histidine kinase
MTIIHSLRLRLLLVLVLVALAPVGTATYLIHRANEQQFRDYSDARTKADAETLVTQIDEKFGAQVVVVDAKQFPVGGVSSAGGADSSFGAVSANSAAANAGVAAGGANGEPANAGSAFETLEDGSTVGDFVTSAGGAGIATGGATAGPTMTVSLPGLPDQQFLSAMTRALLIAVGLATVGALALAVLLARQILKPVETLTAAARGMAAGDLQRRVKVRSFDEIGVLGQAFNTMADSRARLEGLRRNLVNDIAHELRTPLANLQGYLELLRDGLTPPTPQTIAVLHDESLLLSRLVADLQELALAEAGELPLLPESVDVSEPVINALDVLRPQASAKDLTFAAALPENLPLVFVDVARLSQILRNLLRNAIVHTPAGGTIEISAVADRDKNEMVISVRDTGLGIPVEHLPYIFERFYRVDPARARASGGTGLGLPIVKHLIEAHGGWIDVTSTIGVGTTFTFALPLAKAAPTWLPVSTTPRELALT